MKSITKILVSLLLTLVLLFNVVACGDFPTSSNTENNANNENNSNSATNNSQYGDFGKEYDCITVAEAVKIAKGHSTESTKSYYVVAEITEIASLKNGEMTISDGTASILVYRSTDKNGKKLTDSGLAEGDVVLVCGTLYHYKNKTPEFKSAQIIDFYSPENSTLPDINDPYLNVNVEEFYENYTPATDYADAYYRSKHNLLSGNLGDQDQAPTISDYQPKSNGKYIRNSDYLFSEDGNTYYLVDAYGEVYMEIYKGGAYIMIEEVAAYVFAFGEPPANQSSNKKDSPSDSEWGKYLRVNHTVFSGDTSRYPYEPVLPRISGCGGDLTYYEMDIGTTGTDCDPSYTAAVYNNGSRIVRGAARIVYSCEDRNGDKIIDLDERYVFYTYNHYNDFQEYLNYYGGWGEIFGNVTGGGTISSTDDYNPTPYVQVVRASLKGISTISVIYYYVPRRELVA